MLAARYTRTRLQKRVIERLMERSTRCWTDVTYAMLPRFQLVRAVIALLERFALADNIDECPLATIGAEFAREECLHRREAHALGTRPMFANGH